MTFSDPNQQSMEYLNVLLRKHAVHDVEEIDFSRGVTVKDGNVTREAAMAQLKVMNSALDRCPKLDSGNWKHLYLSQRLPSGPFNFIFASI